MTPVTAPVFFVHVMKTGGSSLLRHVADNLPGDAIYPHTLLTEGTAEDLRIAYVSVDQLRGLPEETRRQIRFYSGHMPSVAAEIVGVDEVITVVRDPVERTISMLHQLRRTPGQEHKPIEEIYEDEWWNATLIHNYQSKLFAMTDDECRSSRPHWEPIEMDDRRLDEAKSALDEVAVLGLQEDYARFVDEVRARYGWLEGGGEVHRDRVNDRKGGTPEAFLDRIARDNAADMEFYRHAVALHAARRSRSSIR